MQPSLYLRFSFGLVVLLLLFRCNSERPASVPDVFRSSFFSDRFKVIEEKMYALQFPQALQQLEQLIDKSELSASEQTHAYLQAAFLNLSLEKTKRGLVWIQRFQTTFPDSSKWSTAVRAHYHLVKGMAEYQELELFEAKDEFLTALPLLQKVYTNNHYYVAVGLTQVGLILFDIDYTQVLVNEYIEQAEAIYEYNPSLSNFAWEMYLGKALQANNDRSYQQTQSAIAQGLYIYQNLPFKLPVFHGRCLLALGNALKKKEDLINHGANNYLIADSCFTLAIKLIQPTNSIRLQECYRDFCILSARLSSDNNQFQHNLQTLKRLVKAQGRDVFGFPDRLAAYHNYLNFGSSLVSVQLTKNKSVEARFLNLYEQFLVENKSNPYHRRHLDEAFFVLIRSYASLKDYQKAIYYCQRTTQLFHPERHTKKYINVVGVPMDTNDVSVWISCGWQAEFYLRAAQNSVGIARKLALKKALQLFELFDEHFFPSLLNYNEDASVGILNEVGDLIYPNAMEACYEQYQLTKNEKSLNLGLRFSERRKSFLLYRDMLKQNPDQVVKKDSVRILQSKWNKLYFVLKEQPKQANKDLFLQLNKVEKKLEKALAKLVIDTQAYRKIIEQQSFSLQQIKKQLDSSQQVVQYLIGNDQLFIIGISNTETSFVKVKADSIPYFTKLFLQAIGTQSGFPTAKQNRQYLVSASKLYDYLILPIKNTLAPSKTTIIVPDQFLHQLPFEALLDKKMVFNQALNFSTLPYFLNNGPIVYTPSWKVYVEKIKRKSIRVLPTSAAFWAAKDVLHTQKIKSSLQKIFTKRLNTFEASACSKTQFLQQLIQLKGLVHLSVHAESSIYNRLNNKLKFPADDAYAGQLYGFDVSGMALQKIDLLILGACQSNFGQMSGEGTFSLARSFSQAGVGSIVGTLWSVDNGTTNQLLSRMYHHLSQNHRLEEALWLAKKEFINGHGFSFPGAWAGAVLII